MQTLSLKLINYDLLTILLRVSTFFQLSCLTISYNEIN